METVVRRTIPHASRSLTYNSPWTGNSCCYYARKEKARILGRAIVLRDRRHPDERVSKGGFADNGRNMVGPFESATEMVIKF